MRAFRLLGSDLLLLQVQGLLNQNATLTWLNVRYHNCCARKGVRYLKYNCNYIYIYVCVCVLACSSLPLSILLGSAQFSQFTSPCIHRRHPFDTLFAHLALCARGAVARFLLLEHHSTREGPCSHNAQICEMRNGMRVRCGGIGLFVRVCVWGHIACILSFLRTLFAFCLL